MKMDDRRKNLASGGRKSAGGTALACRVCPRHQRQLIFCSVKIFAGREEKTVSITNEFPPPSVVDGRISSFCPPIFCRSFRIRRAFLRTIEQRERNSRTP